MAGTSSTRSGDAASPGQLSNPRQFPPESDQTDRSEVTQTRPDQPVPPPLSMRERGLPAPAGYTDVRGDDDSPRSVQPADDEEHGKRSPSSHVKD